jgi:hypothetical protein
MQCKVMWYDCAPKTALPFQHGTAWVIDAVPHHTGHLSNLTGLQYLDLVGSFDSCNLDAAALPTMPGAISFANLVSRLACSIAWSLSTAN